MIIQGEVPPQKVSLREDLCQTSDRILTDEHQDGRTKQHQGLRGGMTKKISLEDRS